MKAILVLEDGSTFGGRGFGAPGETTGEVVFNTSMSGYQEILTDPSYNAQIVVMTYPEIGNYGVSPEDTESGSLFVRGFVVREYCYYPSNWRSVKSLGDYLGGHGIVAVEGVDTRQLTRIIRDKGAMRCIISTVDFNRDSLLDKVNSSPQIVGADLVTEVSAPEAYDWSEGSELWRPMYDLREEGRAPFKVVVIDYGTKSNILRRLVDMGFKVTVVPSRTSPNDVLALEPDGILLSNGPGDPEPVTYAIENIRALLGKKPIFGICLGHQILGLAMGGKTFKLKFGHRGTNQPVKNVATGKVEITSQNHSFAVDPETLGSAVDVTHVNLNDSTVEGLRHRSYPAFSVQYHPEASPGPHDSSYLFHEFYNLVKECAS